MSLPDEILAIDTPENVVFGYQVAGIGTRFLAAAVDTLLILVLQVVAYLTLLFVLGSLSAQANLDEGGGVAWVTGAFALVTFLFLWGYYIFFELMWSGQTPGKRWVGLRVIRSNGTPVTLSETVIRNLVRVIDFLPLYYGVGVVTMFLNAQARRLGDLAAGTLVVYDRGPVTLESLRPASSSPVEAMSRGTTTTSAAGRLPLHRLAAEDIALAASYLDRRWQLTNRQQLAVSIATSLLGKMGETAPALGEEDALAIIRAAAALSSQPSAVGKTTGTAAS